MRSNNGYKVTIDKYDYRLLKYKWRIKSDGLFIGSGWNFTLKGAEFAAKRYLEKRFKSKISKQVSEFYVGQGK